MGILRFKLFFQGLGKPQDRSILHAEMGRPSRRGGRGTRLDEPPASNARFPRAGASSFIAYAAVARGVATA
jgi:hypothetical protein